MSLTLQAISDRLEIEDVLINYCDAIDNKALDDFDLIFTKEAVIDYSNFGGPKGSVELIKAFLSKNLNDFPKQHIITNVKIKIDGNQATSRCICFNPQGLSDKTGSYQMAFFGLWYEDVLIRTESGWKIKSRVSKPCYNFNLPTDGS